MAIIANDLHDLLRAKLRDYSDSDEYKNDKMNPLHMDIMAETMQSYLEENLEVFYRWAASNPSSGAPDPVISFQSTVKFGKWDLSKPMTLEGLQKKIVASVSTANIIHPPNFKIPGGSFLIKPLLLQKHDIAQECLMKSIVEPLCDWIITLVNPAPLPGTNGVFAGAAIKTRIL
jgi:hypothetical protein